MFKTVVFRSMGKHVAPSDDLNDLKERINRNRQSRPTRHGMVSPCYGKHCREHHPVTLGSVIVSQLMLERELV